MPISERAVAGKGHRVSSGAGTQRDHGVSTRLLPAGPQLTAIRVWWLVHEDAVEGRDYDLAKLLPFWQLTSEQDWVICERQQKGVNSSAYRPGPYSTFKEYNVEGFVQWYLNMIH